MTSELRPAVEVASAVYDECREKGIRDGGALIKADREAVRAEQAAELAKFKALADTLAGALGAYAEYCDICHGRGSIIEEDSVTGADLWRDCPGCGPATDALRQYNEVKNAG